jgi:hypothetical protein
MSERKVINKYVPPNFDPNNQSTIKRGRVRQKKVRLMAPFSMRCNTCGEFIYKGKKFNARKERAIGEDYLGIQIFRFYIRCPLCASEITFKTDPQNTDYTCERGALRNYEPWRDETKAHQEVKKDREKVEENNPMLALENRTLDSKREMDILDALDEIKTKNSQLEKVDTEAILERLYQGETIEDQIEDLLDKEDEDLAKSIFYGADGTAIKRATKAPILFANESKPVITQKVQSVTVPNLGIKLKTPQNSLIASKPPLFGGSRSNALGIVYRDSDSD